MAELLKKETGIEAELIVGDPGEFAVQVDGATVARKGWLFFPSDSKCLDAVKQAIGG